MQLMSERTPNCVLVMATSDPETLGESSRMRCDNAELAY
jgi:hypothetical protein